MVSVSTLQKAVVYGAVFTVTSCSFFYYKIQSNFAKGPYYQLSLEALLQDEKLVKGLGPPVRPLFLNLGDKENFVVPEKAQLAIPVRGSKYKGILHTRCTKTKDGAWQIQSLILEVNKKSFPVAYNNKSEVGA